MYKNKIFDYNDNFNLYSLKLNNEVGAFLKYEPNVNNSSVDIQLLSKSGRVLSTLPLKDFDFKEVYIQSIEYVNSNTSSPALVVTYENHEPIVCDLTPLWSEINTELDTKVDKTTTIAGIDLHDSITKAELLTGLNVEDGAQVNSVNKVNNKTGDVMLNADDISDENTLNKFVSVEEKSAWTAKQDALSETQLNAVNSGIDSEKVAKIDTNENNISEINGKIPLTTTEQNKLVNAAQMQAFALPITTKYATNLSLAFNNVNGVLTAQLKDQDGNNLGQAQTVEIDLQSLENTINNILALIPAQASVQNQLADKNFVNSSISTNTAHFIGTFNSLEELEAYTGTVTNNDYANVIRTVDGQTYYDRYTYNDNTKEWEFNFSVNTTSFTATQWAALNSGITASLVDKLNGIESGAQVNTVNSVNNKTGSVILNADDISDAQTAKKFVSQSDINRWNNSSSVVYTTDEDIDSLFN